MEKTTGFTKRLDFMIQFFRLISIILFAIYLYSVFSLIQYDKFLKFNSLLFVFVLMKRLLVLFIYFMFFLVYFIASQLGLDFIPPNAGILTLLGFTNMNNALVDFLSDPTKGFLEILPNIVTGVISLTFLLIALFVLGYLNRGNINFALWIFFLAEIALILSFIFGYQTFQISEISSVLDLMGTPLFTHALIAIFYLEAFSQLSYISTFLIPIKDRIKRNEAMIKRFESLTPQEVSEGVVEEMRERRLLEKLSPIASLFTSDYYVGPVHERRFNMRYLAKLKSYYDFIKEKDPELREKIIGLKTVPTTTEIFFRMILSSVLKLIIIVGLTMGLLFLPQAYAASLLGSKIFELSLIEVYVIFVATAVLLFYVASEFLRRI